MISRYEQEWYAAVTGTRGVYDGQAAQVRHYLPRAAASATARMTYRTLPDDLRRSRKPCLSDGDVRQIRALYATGRITQTALAKRFGVSVTTIFMVVRRFTYRDVA